jgi:hypothetical protein
MKRRSLVALGVGVVVLSAATVMACDGEENAPVADPLSQEIVGGAEARTYESAALIDIEVNGTVRSICSGSLIAPRIVLTAGHCVAGDATAFRVLLPYSNNQRVRSSRGGIVYDYVDTGHNVNPNQRDVGLIILDQPATLRQFPRLARTPVDEATGVVKVGRIDNGRASYTSLFASRPMRVVLGNRYGYPYSYVSSEVIQPGDSGGPNYVSGSNVPTIVAVNSGAGGGTEVLARVDVLATWLDQRVAQNGGYAPLGDGGIQDGGLNDDASAEAGRSDASSTDASTPDSSMGSRDAAVDDEPSKDKKTDEAEEDVPAKAGTPDRADDNRTAPTRGTPEAQSDDDRLVKPKTANAGCSVSVLGHAGSASLLAICIGVVFVALRRRREAR